jgi:multicomponent Na+:H+ antiporter subunit F
MSWNEIALLTAFGVAIALAAVRVFIGPTLADRVVAIDYLALTGVSMMAAAAVVFDETAFLDVALLLALVAFISTAAFARYLGRRADETRSERS